MPPPSFPEYPFADFARDFAAVDRAVEDARATDQASGMLVLGGVLRKVYSDANEVRRRGAALAMARAFLENHLGSGHFRHHVRNVAGGALYSEGLFEAVYLVVAGFALDPSRPLPEPGAVARVADEREKARRPAGFDSPGARFRRWCLRMLRP